MTRWLVTGAGGMLGHDLVAELRRTPATVVTAATRAACDITDPAAVRAAVAGHDVVVNAAGWTRVDDAEQFEAQATAVNGTGAGYLAQACADSGAVLLQLSTDYVFSGDRTSAYPEGAPTAPVNAYGRGKLVGEQAVRSLLPDRGYVVRTAWLYGDHGPNFVSTMVRLARTQPTVQVITDQVGQPTSSLALAHRLVELGQRALAGRAPAGVYHATASGRTTWYDFARVIFAHAGFDPERVRPTTSAEYRRPARRPSFSVLGHDAWLSAGLGPMAHWRAMLQSALAKTALLGAPLPVHVFRPERGATLPSAIAIPKG